MQRLIVVYNPRSSNFSRVKSEVLDKLPNLKGYTVGKYIIKKTNFDDNVATLSEILRDGDAVLAAGGDATAAIAMNAIMKSGKDATMSALPYGNFNDFASTAGSAQGKTYHPLAIYIDGKLWRYASCYVSIGMMAESTQIFDSRKVRTKLQRSRRTHFRSYLTLACWYFKNHRREFLPEFTINGRPVPRKTSDYFAVNGSRIAGIMKGREDYKAPKTFHSAAGRLTSFFRLINFMAKSIFRHIPAEPTTGDLLEFSTPTKLTIQAEGESAIFAPTTIKIKKSPTSLSVTNPML